MHISHVTRFRKEWLVTDQTKIQDIVRHITKDEDGRRDDGEALL